MKVIELNGGWGLEHVAIAERDATQPGPGEVAIEMRAASLNYRDLVFVRGGYGRAGTLPRILLSDGAGVVVAAAPDVTRVAVGDIVCPITSPGWLTGPLRETYRDAMLGIALDGVMAERVIAKAEAVVRAPKNLSAAEAATLPCAAVTAWNALMMAGTKAGDLVLTQGTGGVSLFALQFARALGATVVVTSSSDDKLQRARAMGAQLGINYRHVPEWGQELRRLSGGRGADLVIEVAGAQSLPQSLRAVRTGGTVALIGVLSGGLAELELGRVVTQGLRLQAVTIGPRDSFEAMNGFIEQHNLKPAIDERRFTFGETRAAIATIGEGRHFGKLVIEF
jgi:NADPH:quinone reductase-like Zn-dependent oxidoreductase